MTAGPTFNGVANATTGDIPVCKVKTLGLNDACSCGPTVWMFLLGRAIQEGCMQILYADILVADQHQHAAATINAMALQAWHHDWRC